MDGKVRNASDRWPLKGRATSACAPSAFRLKIRVELATPVDRSDDQFHADLVGRRLDLTDEV
jgi:hypothetical protein